MRFLSSVLVAGMALLCAAPVSADPSTTSRLGWVTNGDVHTAVQVGNTLYVGGTFTRVAPASGALGSFFGVSTITGDPLPLFPLVDGVVHAVEPDGAGGYYIGGAFTRVGGVARTNLAHVLVGGTVDPAFAPTIGGGSVFSLALGSSFLFVGGNFTTVNGALRDDFAALNPATGASAAFPFPPASINNSVQTILIAGANVLIIDSPQTLPVQTRALALNQTTGASVWSTSLLGSARAAIVAGAHLIVGGYALQADGRTVASLDIATGVIDPTWAPSGTPPPMSAQVVHALAVVGSTLYVGGAFSTFGGQPRANAAAVNIPTGTVTAWAPDPNGIVSALATTLTGTTLMGGTFTQVDGESRETVAEVDASGTATALLTKVQAAHVQTMRVDAAGNVVVGGHLGVTDAEPRTNLAAFDLSSDTLLPWAPAVAGEIVKLAAIGNRIFVGASQLVTDPVPHGRGVISAVDGTTGALLSWTAPASVYGLTLVGTSAPHVYVSGIFSSQEGGAFVRLLETTGAIDPSFRVRWLGGPPTEMAISGDTLFIGGGFGLVGGVGAEAVRQGLAALDVVTGTLSPWNPTLVAMPGLSVAVTVEALALDGRTMYVAYTAAIGGTPVRALRAIDVVSGLPTAGAPLGGDLLLGASVGALGVADGQLIVARDTAFMVPPIPPAATGVAAFTTTGQASAWNPGYGRTNINRSFAHRPGLLVTPTGIIVLGYNAATPVPVQGVAVLPRTPSPTPTSLRATTIDNQVTLAWNAASPPPTSEYVLDVATTSGSSNPISLPTGSTAPTVTGVAGNGTYYVRVRSSGAPAGPASLPTNEIALVVGCSAAPSSPPLGLAAQVSGSNVTLSWNAPPFSSLSTYVLEAGSSAGATDIATLTFPASQTTVGGAVPPGTYFVRMRTANACGDSATSSDVFFTVGSPSAIPAAPTGLTVNVTGSLVAVQWTPSPGAAGYILEAGSAPGLSNIAALPVSSSTFFVNGVPNGVYHLRVRAASAAGLSAPSSEFVVVVPQ